MKYIYMMLLVSILDGCAWFGGQSDSQIPTIPAPAQKNLESSEAMPIIQDDKFNASAEKVDLKANNSGQQTQRSIQEDRANGVVDQIKVNNKNLPSYYIYPTQQQNYDHNSIPNQNVSVPNWQISW